MTRKEDAFSINIIQPEEGHVGEVPCVSLGSPEKGGGWGAGADAASRPPGAPRRLTPKNGVRDLRSERYVPSCRSRRRMTAQPLLAFAVLAQLPAPSGV